MEPGVPPERIVRGDGCLGTIEDRRSAKTTEEETEMANQRIPDERFPNDPSMAGMRDVPPNPQRLDSDLQVDPELVEGPSSTGRVAAFAIGIAILLAAVFYGLNNSSTGNNQASNPPPTQSAQTQPANPAQMNKDSGVTTGAATNRPTPPANAPTGSEADHSAPPPTGENNNTH
jgi:hypothetical protein